MVEEEPEQYSAKRQVHERLMTTRPPVELEAAPQAMQVHSTYAQKYQLLLLQLVAAHNRLVERAALREMRRKSSIKASQVPLVWVVPVVVAVAAGEVGIMAEEVVVLMEAEAVLVGRLASSSPPPLESGRPILSVR